MSEKVNKLVDRATSLASSSIILVIAVIGYVLVTQFKSPEWLTLVISLILGIALYQVAKDVYKLLNLPEEIK